MSQSGGSTTHRYDVRDGGLLKEEVTLRKRSENRHYTDSDGVRDSIVMGNLSGGFLDNLGKMSLIDLHIVSKPIKFDIMPRKVQLLARILG